jgi:hypothetical protein
MDTYRKLDYVAKNLYPEPLEDVKKPDKIRVRAYLTDLSLPSWGKGLTFEELSEAIKDLEEYAKEEDACNLSIREHEYSDYGDTYYSVVVLCERIENDKEFKVRMQFNEDQLRWKKECEERDRKQFEKLKKKFEPESE